MGPLTLITDNYTIGLGTATALANSKGKETQRIHFNNIGDDQIICDLAIERLADEGVNTKLDGLSCFKNAYWVVMGIGDDQKVLLNRNSTIKRLGELNISREAVERAFESHNMEQIRALITQAHAGFTQEVHDQFRANVTEYANDNPGELKGESIADFVARICDALLPTFANITTEEYVQLYLSPNRAAELEARKNALVQQLENDIEQYLINHQLYRNLLNNVIIETQTYCDQYAKNNPTIVDTTIDRNSPEWKEQLQTKLKTFLSESEFTSANYATSLRQLNLLAQHHVEHTAGFLLLETEIMPIVEKLDLVLPPLGDQPEDLPVQ